MLEPREIKERKVPANWASMRHHVPADEFNSWAP